MKYPFYILDVFSSRPFGGNQLGMLPDARGISTDGMQKIAREFNFAETTFVFPPVDHKATARVRIFTSMAEVDFAGHPTVGTACGLIYGGHTSSREIILEENIGPITVEVKNLDSKVNAEQCDEVLTGMLTNTTALDYPDEKPDLSALAQLLGLDASMIIDGCYGSVGLKFCFAQLSSEEAVDAAVIDRAKWEKYLSGAWSPNLFFFSGGLTNGGQLYARMSAPALGIEEDPATGSAVATLVGIAAKNSGMFDGDFCLSVLQGVAMGRRSEMQASATVVGGEVRSVSVGGASTLTATGEIEVESRWLI
ncbi:MAG: PhzF family phenazine biosynthesis isomerase [Gammaproteobacteria bacterium]|nr:PhzF family phenazine biosynthesis isomerase [Gammaproteobacteria bacterium]